MNLLNATVGSKVIVKEIAGGLKMKKNLEDLGIIENTKLEILSTKPVHEHKGSIEIKINDKEIILGRGMADKIYLDAGNSILQLEEGGKGIIEKIEESEAIRKELLELGIKEGNTVNFLKHIPDDILVFETKDEDIMIGEGEASKILVEVEGKIMQSNFMKEAVKGKVSKIIGGLYAKEKFKEKNLLEGDEITLVKRKKERPIHERSNYIKAKISETEDIVTIGHGMAEKVEVEIVE